VCVGVGDTAGKKKKECPVCGGAAAPRAVRVAAALVKQKTGRETKGGERRGLRRTRQRSFGVPRTAAIKQAKTTIKQDSRERADE
jgi:hypothetical protein